MATTDQLRAALEGRYAIERLIGEGGMATVYLARDLRHQRKVALKVLRPDLGAVVGIDRFLSEIQVTANLQHPNLLPLFDSGAADGLLFYVMPYVEGESLRARLTREKQLPIEEAIHIATSVASALDYAHRHGVIHRDLKPENILLHEGEPLVADFGIALAVSKAGGNRITQTGVSLGTPQYMSPEQATGDRLVDNRTDVYSLGAVTYEMLTGDPPHMGSTSQAVIARVLTEQPRSIRASRPNVTEHLEAAVERALEKLPADRYATAREFSEALTGARFVSRSTAARTAGETAAQPAPVWRRRRVRELAGWVAAAIVTGFALVSTVARPEPTPVVPVEFEIQLQESLDIRSVGTVATVALSRDGSTLVFQGRRPNEPPMLFVRRLDDRVVQPIQGSDSARSPVLSPDGTEVLFAPMAGIGASTTPIKRLPIRGGNARTVVDSASANGQIAWGEDGRLVFAFDNALWMAPASGGRRRLLARPDSSRGHLRYGFLDVLPDGGAALITIWKTELVLDSAVLGVVSIPGGAVTEFDIRGTYPRYSPTGHLLYATMDAWLMAVPFDAASRRVTGAPFPVAEGVRVGSGGAAAFGVARNGTLAYIGGGLVQLERNVVAVTRDGKERSVGAKPGAHSTPVVSPDGRQIAWTAGTSSPGNRLNNPDVWRFDTSSKVLTRVTTDSNSLRPRWSADGERIAFLRPGDSVVMWRPLYAIAEATPLFRVPHNVGDYSLGPTGYGALRMRRSNSQNDDVWLVHADSPATPRPFLNQPYSEMAPQISPTGRLLAYVTNRTGRNEVYVRPLAGDGPEVQVSIDGGSEPVWSRDGSELFYRGPTHLMAARMTVGPGTFAVVRRASLFRDEYVRLAVSTNYDVFPGAREFVMVRQGFNVDAYPLIVKLNWHVTAPAGDRPN